MRKAIWEFENGLTQMKHIINTLQIILPLIVVCLFFTISANAQSAYHGGKGDGYASAEIQNVVLSINPLLSQIQTVNLYPNPAKASENLQIIMTSTEPYKVEIINLLGQVIFIKNCSGEKGIIPLSYFKPGSYIVCVHNENCNYIQKLVIVNQ